MSRNSNPIELKTPSDAVGEASAVDPADDFVAPQDLIGEDLAAQLQEVLDEAAAHLSDPAAPPTSAADATDAAAVESHEEDGAFESPAQVLAADRGQVADSSAVVPDHLATIAAPAAPPVEEVGVSFEEQLRELMALASGKKSEPAPSAALAEDHDLEATSAQARSLTQELEQMSAMIGKAVSPSPAAHAGSRPPAEAPAEVQAESVTQLDEILAGHADHAVADEFETVNDVIELEKALAELKTEAPSAASTPKFAPPQQAAPPADAGVRYADDSPAPMAAGAAPPAKPAAAETAQTAATPDEPVPRAAPAAAATIAAVRPAPGLRDKLLRLCLSLNRPLRNVAAPTRNLVGYAGLLTLANGAMLVLIKLLRG
jgi:hypothetical protein